MIRLKEELLNINNLKTHFFTSRGVIKAVDGINVKINRRESVGIVGESGSGKSVTALSIMKLVPNPPGRIVDGQIILDGEDLLTVSEKEMRIIRGKKIAMCFQDPMTFLNPVMRIGDQIAETIKLHQEVTEQEAMDLAISSMETVKIPSPAERAVDFPHQLSGGMRQRVLIAIAISCNPDLLITDEPTTALDVITQANILDLLIEIKNTSNASILMISHDLGIIAQTCDFVYVMYNGRILESGAVKQLFKDPLHPYTKGLLASLPRIHGKIRKKLLAIPGTVADPIYPPSGCRFHPRCQNAMPECSREEPKLIDIGNNRAVACYLVNDPKET
jgi:oligopeptide/dipeptide ABC transporter ATP-binding protein